jgi:hypothetical protein
MKNHSTDARSYWFVSGCEEGYLFETKLDGGDLRKKAFPRHERGQ